jgi:tryptophan synthase alpha chain
MIVKPLRSLFASGAKKLVVYVTAGDPSLAASADVVVAAARAGADVIELGMPFSDPSADGPAIQLAMTRALTAGATPLAALDVLRRVRAAGCAVPVILFGYYNPVFVHGVERFCRAAAAAGAQGLLLVDLPVDELGELQPAARAAALDVIPLVAPTSPPARMARVAALEAPFVYYVSMTGVTGAALTGMADLPARIAAVRAAVGAPVAVGFGIATPDDARGVAAAADAVVVGSAVVREIERHPEDPAGAVGALVAALAAGVRGPAGA